MTMICAAALVCFCLVCAGRGYAQENTTQAILNLRGESLTPQQQDLVAYFESMTRMQQRLSSHLYGGASPEETARMLDGYLADLKRMPVPASIRQYHDALVKIIETGNAYRAQGASGDPVTEEEMMQEFNTILGNAGMLEAVEQQMRIMGEERDQQ
jgi:hypothetical protein